MTDEHITKVPQTTAHFSSDMGKSWEAGEEVGRKAEQARIVELAEKLRGTHKTYVWGKGIELLPDEAYNKALDDLIKSIKGGTDE